MKSANKLLSMLLALVMTLGLVTVPASASSLSAADTSGIIPAVNSDLDVSGSINGRNVDIRISGVIYENTSVLDHATYGSVDSVTVAGSLRYGNSVELYDNDLKRIAGKTSEAFVVIGVDVLALLDAVGAEYTNPAKNGIYIEQENTMLRYYSDDVPAVQGSVKKKTYATAALNPGDPPTTTPDNLLYMTFGVGQDIKLSVYLLDAYNNATDTTGKGDTPDVVLTISNGLSTPFVNNLVYGENETLLNALTAGYEDGAQPDPNITLKTTGFIIDLENETLKIPSVYKNADGSNDSTVSFSIAAYSTDGGAKWKTGTIGSQDGASISRLLSKDLELVLVTKFDKAEKSADKGSPAVVTPDGSGDQPLVPGGMTIRFPKINARPKIDKLVVNYSIYADDTAATTGQWTLTEKGATLVDSAAVAALQVAAVPPGGKAPDAKGWGTIQQDRGVDIKATTGSKPEKLTYLVRSAPIGGNDGSATPASKVYKVTVLSTLVAPRLKVDYKKELIKGKSDVVVKLGKSRFTSKEEARAAIMDKDAARAGLSFAGTLGLGDSYAIAYTVATAKKPASNVQIIQLAEAARLDDTAISINKGKLRPDKKFEMLVDAATGKHGPIKFDYNAKPEKVENIRIKSSAKAGKTGISTGNSASEYGTLFLTWGKDAKDRDIITDARLIGPDYKDGKLVLYPADDNVYEWDGTTATELTFGVKNALYAGSGIATVGDVDFVIPGYSDLSPGPDTATLTADLAPADATTLYNGLSLPTLMVEVSAISSILNDFTIYDVAAKAANPNVNPLFTGTIEDAGLAALKRLSGTELTVAKTSTNPVDKPGEIIFTADTPDKLEYWDTRSATSLTVNLSSVTVATNNILGALEEGDRITLANGETTAITFVATGKTGGDTRSFGTGGDAAILKDANTSISLTLDLSAWVSASDASDDETIEFTLGAGTLPVGASIKVITSDKIKGIGSDSQIAYTGESVNGASGDRLHTMEVDTTTGGGSFAAELSRDADSYKITTKTAASADGNTLTITRSIK